MKCPICNVDLLMSERQGFEIDYCPECRGIWLDRGELDKIIERSASQGGSSQQAAAQQQSYQPQQQPQQQYRDDYDYHKHDEYKKHKKKRPTSFLEDIFDF